VEETDLWAINPLESRFMEYTAVGVVNTHPRVGQPKFQGW